MKAISVIIPAYNEEDGIGKVVDEVEATLKKSGLERLSDNSRNGSNCHSEGAARPKNLERKRADEILRFAQNDIIGQPLEYEIIAINDGSTDKTGEILKEKPVKLLEHMINQGYGASIKHGLSQAKYEYVLILDADGTYPEDAIPMLLKDADRYDMVVGARTGKEVAIPPFRKFPKWVLKKLSDYLVGMKIPDLNSGLRVFKKEVALKFLNLLPSGFSFTTTITLALLSNNYQVHYIPINYYKRRGKSKFRPLQDTFNLITLILRTSLYFNPLKIFVPFSLILFLLAILVFVYSKFFTPKVMDITIIVILMSAVQIMALGLIADLVDKRTQR